MLDLQTPRGKVVGIGRIKVPRMPELGFNHDVPPLSFVVIGREDGCYVATCIHLQMDGYGDTIKDARENMVSDVYCYLQDLFAHAEDEAEAWDALYELSKSNPRSDLLWDKYHAIQFELAKKRVYTSSYNNSPIENQSCQKSDSDTKSLDAGRLDAGMYRSMIVKYEEMACPA
ncbi:MAG: hypothetical protein LBC59_07235 [Chitinispirillales bacterium]|nr:hypothetical protein [Chitinispirillales bacterium]